MTTTPKITTFKASAVKYNFNTMTPVWEWETERNEGTFIKHGYWCQIKRHEELKHLCGYVLIGKTHPYWTLDTDLAVHGGITYSDGTKVGFDCGHAGDLTPYIFLAKYNFGGGKYPPEVYRNWSFVTWQLDNLAKQLRDMDTREIPTEHV